MKSGAKAWAYPLVGGGVAVAALAVGGVIGWRLRDSRRDSAPVPKTISSGGAASSSPAIEAEPEKVVERWFRATTSRERLSLLYRPDVNQHDFLDRTAAALTPKSARIDFDGCADIPIDMDGSCIIGLRVPDDTPLLVLRGTADGYRVDWRASYTVSDTGMAAFQAVMPIEPTIFRAHAKLDTYFNYEFMGAQADYYSFRVSHSGRHIYTYGKKGAPDADAMFRALSGGQEEMVTIAIAFPPSRRSNEITKLVTFYGTSFVQTARESKDLLARHSSGKAAPKQERTGANSVP